jgi:hypothetical protein
MTICTICKRKLVNGLDVFCLTQGSIFMDTFYSTKDPIYMCSSCLLKFVKNTHQLLNTDWLRKLRSNADAWAHIAQNWENHLCFSIYFEW